MINLSGKLLLYEDLDDNLCKMLAPALQSMGLHTRLVSDIGACLEAVRTNPPNAVFIITNNIRENGAFETAKAIRTLHRNCGFVFVAGSDTDGRERCLAAGYRFCVHDIPMPMKELATLISEAINSPMETFVIPQSAPAE